MSHTVRRFRDLFMTIIFPILVIGFFVVTSAFGDETVLPIDTTVSFWDWVSDAFNVFTSLKAMPLWAGVLAVLKLLTDALKTDVVGNLFEKLGPIGKRLVPVFLATLTVGVSVLAAGGTWGAALTAIIGSAGGSMLLHEIWTAIRKALGWS